MANMSDGTIRYCPRCGAALPAGATFCPACGGAVGGAPAPVAVPQSTNGLAVAGLVLGIIWIFWLGSLLALIFGYVAKSQIDESGGTQGGRGMAVAAIVLGWIGAATFVITLLFGNINVHFGST
jgi:hypothetical protein